jgi:guanosine-3',5'-bis(diphosphate) 3'-pyrophosphohydrolase
MSLFPNKRLRLFKTLRRKLKYLKSDQIELVYQAYLTADAAHQGQKRLSGEPYITHPVAVAMILAEMRMDHQSIMAALMHDVIEDSTIDKEALTTKFGKSVAELVDGVSKLTLIAFQSRAEAQAENFRKMVLAMSRDIRVILVKLADRLHNMRTLGPLQPERRRRIALETLEIYAPIAHRLGMHTIAVELEELGFEAYYPLRFRVLKEAVRRLRGYRKQVLNRVESALKEGMTKSGLPQWEMTGREKHLYSIYKKMRDKHIPLTDIMDIYAFRIKVSSIDSCYRALGVVHGLFKPLLERFKDYIALPKANGYQSLHTTLFGPYGVPIEIQIRTQEMDERADKGIAAHWLYKAGESQSIDVSQMQAQRWVNNLLELQQNTGSSLEFIENVKIDLFPKEVYVFTPKGSILQLPAGATVVDFAYAVHTDVGNTCVAARIDRQLAPLSTVLSNGQTVEIITSSHAQPNPSWLNFVITGKARSSIRHVLKNQYREESVALGRELLNKALFSLGLPLEQISNINIREFLYEAQIADWDDLLEEIGLGNRVAMLDAHRLVNLAKGQIQIESQAKSATGTGTKSLSPLLIKGTEGVVVKFATCCYPIPGDPIVGLLKAGQGIEIHTAQCKYAAKFLKHPDNVMWVSWHENIREEFVVSMEIDMLNRKGVLASVTFAIANAESNIEDISINGRDTRHIRASLKLLVKNRKHLADVIRSVRKVKAVLYVGRSK